MFQHFLGGWKCMIDGLGSLYDVGFGLPWEKYM